MPEADWQAGVDPGRVVADLRELASLTADANGAQRLCWTDTWARAREWFASKLAGLPVTRKVDAAGNVWVTLEGRSATEVVVGSHLDSVPNGGWLDGALGVLSGLELLRALSASGQPPVTVRLVDWADEEGARFGYGMLGSSAVSGTLDLEHVRTLRDRGGESLPDVLGRHGVKVDEMKSAGGELERAAAYLELHIEQGPVLERLDLPLAAVLGTCGVERHVVRFEGEMAHAGSTPMEDRRDAFAAAAKLALAVREPAIAEGAVTTTGRCDVWPGIATAVAGRAELTLDQRHLDGEVLQRLLDGAKRESERIAEEEGVSVSWSNLWRIEPVAFDEELIAFADSAIEELVGKSHKMPSGPLHDAAEVARAGVPTVMLFVQSLRGLSHNKDEDTRVEHLELSVRALARTLDKVMAKHAAA